MMLNKISLPFKIRTTKWFYKCRIMLKPFDRGLNPLSPNSDENEISLYIITTCSNIRAMGRKKVSTKD